MEVIKISNLKEIKKAAKKFIELIGNNTVFAFYGEMGAGKTTLIKAICIELGVSENITSPTFALVNEYYTKGMKAIYHFDCYRLKNEQEAMDIGIEDYFYSENLCFIEWPEKIEQMLPLETVSVFVNVLPDESREVTIDT